MSLSIQNLNSSLPAVPLPPTIGKTDSVQGGSFAGYLMDSLKQVNSMQAEANHAVETLAVGGEVNPAEVLTAAKDKSFGGTERRAFLNCRSARRPADDVGRDGRKGSAGACTKGRD